MKNILKGTILSVLAAQDISTESHSGMQGQYGLLFGLVIGTVLRYAVVDHGGEIHLTVSDLQTASTRTERFGLLEAVNSGLVQLLRETCATCRGLPEVSVIGDLGQLWASHEPDVTLTDRFAFNHWPELHCLPQMSHDINAAD